MQEGQRGPQAEPGQELGPEAELAFWRARAVKLNSITEQLKAPACRSVLAVTGAARSKQYKAWRKMDVEVRQLVLLVLMLASVLCDRMPLHRDLNQGCKIQFRIVTNGMLPAQHGRGSGHGEIAGCQAQECLG